MTFARILTISAFALTSLAITSPSNAGGRPTSGTGVSVTTPGQQMQSATTSTAPGASEYAPGTLMRDSTTSTPPGQTQEPGASGFAPGDAHSRGRK